ncbi:MAG: hypothetical protein OXC40_03455 [Proteobacteria bacterium]|nr:hypothetical protein [Pseudomonadota bacterium]
MSCFYHSGWLGYVLGVWLCVVFFHSIGYSKSRPLPLQTGGVGSGYVFSAVTAEEWGSEFILQLDMGRIVFDDSVNNTLESQRLKTTLKNAYSYRPDSRFYIVAGLDIISSRYQESMRQSFWTLNRHSLIADYRFSTSVVLDRDQLILAGSVGLNLLGPTERLLKNREQFFKTEQSFGLYPTSAMSVGVKFRHFIILSQVSLPGYSESFITGSHSQNPNHASDSSESHQGTMSYDHEIGQPFEMSLNLLADIDSEFQVASTLMYSLAGRDSRPYNQWSQRQDDTGERLFALNYQQGDVPSRIDRNTWSVSGGVRYFASHDLSVSFALSYQSPGYLQPDFASLELDNLGGYETSFDVEFFSHRSLKWSVGALYQYPRKVRMNYRYLSQYDDLLTHQNIPLEKSTRALVSQKKYGLFLSLSYVPPPPDEIVDEPGSTTP